MRKSFLVAVAAATLGTSMWSSSFAGPLRDLLMQRAAEKRGADMQEEDSSLTAKGPFDLPRGAMVERDLSYGSDSRQTIDVYRPEHADNAPVIFMVHGGGWRHGDKGLHRVVKNKVRHWVAKGYVLISVNYRMLPEADPLQQADDVAKALAFAQAKARAWGGDPSRFVLMGHSAGAHLVALISADPTIATRAGAKPWLGTVALDSAAYDVSTIMQGRHFRLFDQAFKNDPAVWRDASPLHRLKSAPVPMLLVCSSRRDDSCAQAKGFASKAESLGGRVTVLPMDLSHSEINDRLGTSGEYTASVESFLKSLSLP